MKSYTLQQFLELKPQERAKLKHVSISTLVTQSKIHSVDYAFAECVNLTHLCIENNNVPENYLIFRDILLACLGCRKLQCLKISRNKLGQLENYQLKNIVSAIFRLTWLNILHMSDNDFGRLDKFGWILLFSIPTWCSLSKWDFCGNNLEQFNDKVKDDYHNIVISSPTLQEAVFDPHYLDKLSPSEWSTFISKLKSCKLSSLHMSSSLRNERMNELILNLKDLYYIKGTTLTQQQDAMLKQRRHGICNYKSQCPDLEHEIDEYQQTYLPSRHETHQETQALSESNSTISASNSTSKSSAKKAQY